MKNYLEVLQGLVDKYDEGSRKADRTGTGTVSRFGTQLRFDISDGKVPLLTTKRLHLKSIIHELVWFFRGSGNIAYLRDNGIKIWDEWADSNGNLGPVYPEMWRQWPDFIENFNVPLRYPVGYNLYSRSESIDQLQIVIDSIRMNPTSRRHIVSGWNPAVLPNTKISPKENASLGKQALPPCHTLFQFNCEELSLLDRWRYLDKVNFGNGRLFDAVKDDPDTKDAAEFLDTIKVPKYYLDCQLYQRSADWFLGVPFNIASYSILTHIIGRLTNTVPREFIHTFGDYHLYVNHIEQAREQLKRVPKAQTATIQFNREWKSIDDVVYEDITINNYEAEPNIKAPVAV